MDKDIHELIEEIIWKLKQSHKISRKEAVKELRKLLEDYGYEQEAL